MTDLSQHHLALGGHLAPDRIPLDYGHLPQEWAAARRAAVLLDRTHEGRILVSGRDRLALVNRMSTNDVAQLAQDQGAPTVFTNPNARILFRALCCERPEGLLLISEPGQGAALAEYLRRNIFFGDKAIVQDISAQTAQFALLGPNAAAIVASLRADAPDLPLYGAMSLDVAGGSVTVVRRKPICGGHLMLICSQKQAVPLHQVLLDQGQEFGLTPAGSLTYNSLRIAEGRPAGLELSAQYLPLEVGLWDEISFSKGCYTGQEIIARMESRARLAKTLVKVALSAHVNAPAPISFAGQSVGTLTSSAVAADGEVYALGVIKLPLARPGQSVSVGADAIESQILAYAGAQAPFILEAAGKD